MNSNEYSIHDELENALAQIAVLTQKLEHARAGLMIISVYKGGWLKGKPAAAVWAEDTLKVIEAVKE